MTPAGEISSYHTQMTYPCTKSHEHTLPQNPCCLHRSADIALIAGGKRKRWIIATENMQAGDIIKTSGLIGRMAGIQYPRWLVVS